MGLRLIRENSNTPNVTNTDDVRMVRYAYGGYNGFVKGKGRELACEANGNTLIVNSGVIVIQGWEVEVDSNGWSMQVSLNDATKRFYTVYCEINLSMGETAAIKSISDTVSYPTVAAGDDLTKNTNGIARITLCKFIAQRGLISECIKTIQEIPYLCSQLEIMNQRLKEQGFREASVDNGEIVLKNDWADATIADGVPNVTFIKSGKLVVFKKLSIATKTDFEYNLENLQINSVVGYISEMFAPQKDVTITDITITYNDGTDRYPNVVNTKYMILHPNGEIELRLNCSQIWYKPKHVRVSTGLILEIDGNNKYHVWIKNFEEDA